MSYRKLRDERPETDMPAVWVRTGQWSALCMWERNERGQILWTPIDRKWFDYTKSESSLDDMWAPAEAPKP